MRTYLACLVLAACSSQSKSPIDDDFSSFAGADVKSDSFSYRMKIVGSLDYSETSVSTTYTKSPRYRTFKFSGHEHDDVDVWVRSTDGDSVAWVLDNGFHVLASNDDADDSTFDSHISLTLPANASATHYIVFRDYSLSKSHFTVSLSGGPTFDTSCETDADCASVNAGGCCPDGTLAAVNAGSTDAYAAATACNVTPHPLCPAHVILDRRVAQCDNSTKKCAMIAPEEIHCGGFIMNSHACPTGFVCHFHGVPDVGGSCQAE